MDMTRVILSALPILFVAVALVRLFRTPLKLAVRLLGNTALGFAALWGVNLAAPAAALPGFNLWNALVIAVLGVPGFILLLLLQWIL